MSSPPSTSLRISTIMETCPPETAGAELVPSHSTLTRPVSAFAAVSLDTVPEPALTPVKVNVSPADARASMFSPAVVTINPNMSYSSMGGMAVSRTLQSPEPIPTVSNSCAMTQVNHQSRWAGLISLTAAWISAVSSGTAARSDTTTSN